MAYPMYGAYVLLTAQTPAADPAFTRIPIDHEDSWQNAGYTVQWWLFAGMALFSYGLQARKEAQTRRGRAGGAAPRRPGPGERVADAGPMDRVEAADLRRKAAAEADRRL